MSLSKMLSTMGLVGIALAGAGYLQVTQVDAAGPPAASQQAATARASAASPAAALPQRALLDQYCVTCHNEKLKTAGLMLDKLDVGDVKGNAEVLEKVVRKLRSEQMPPEGRPRPDAATLNGFAAA